jgi:hypothetical protein
MGIWKRGWTSLGAAGARLCGTIGLLLCVTATALGILTSADLPSHAATGPTPGVGFTLHTLYMSTLGRFDLPTFEANVHELAAQHMQWIRVDLWPDVVAPSGTVQSIHWNAANLATYDQALSYAKQMGLKVYLDTSVPNYTREYTESDYLAVAQMYYQAIAARYHSYVDMWQIANEPNWSDFRDSSKPLQQPYSMSYVQSFDRLLAFARRAIKAAAPSAPVAINLTLSNSVPMNVNPFLSVTAPHIDVIGVDSYPGMRVDLLDRAVAEMKGLEQRYHKPTMVVETGLCSATYGADGQSTYIPVYISHFLMAHPLAVLIYLYQDSPKWTSVSACDKTYGLVDVTGKDKPSFGLVFRDIQAILHPAHQRPPSRPAKPKAAWQASLTQRRWRA